MKELIAKLQETQTLAKAEWITLLSQRTPDLTEELFERACRVRIQHYGKNVYIRGLIEFTNYCRNDCYYCGIRKSNRNISRYRLSCEEILSCCHEGYELGFRTFVLQGGEDPWFTDQRMAHLITLIKEHYPDCAVTLSIGEKEEASYRLFREAGADRYLLRHETFHPAHYRHLHPQELSASHRQQCLFTLRNLGFQVGSGFMVGSPGQTPEYLAEDMLFLKKLNPHMVGIGPFVPHHDTPFAQEQAGTLELTLYLLGLLRLMLPKALLPATTALGALSENGQQLGILAGANVIMPNLSPLQNRALYSLYDNKPNTGTQAAENLAQLCEKMNQIGYKIVTDRGDSLVY
ncbi:MAG: [FeFe] hydrogenase H-cluster radical SAM maturase HydE [Eubacteriales bacterium]|nr:[FeFe] hydrogenase H-cluster radical SAM maturase HydE [Eubacteriales bacterium]